MGYLLVNIDFCQNVFLSFDCTAKSTLLILSSESQSFTKRLFHLSLRQIIAFVNKSCDSRWKYLLACVWLIVESFAVKYILALPFFYFNAATVATIEPFSNPLHLFALCFSYQTLIQTRIPQQAAARSNRKYCLFIWIMGIWAFSRDWALILQSSS